MVDGPDAFLIVEDCGQTVGRSLRELDVTLNNGSEHQFLEMPLHLVINLVGQTQAAVIHRKEKTFNFQSGIQPLLNHAYGVEQLADTFQSEIFALHGNDYRIGRRKGIHRNETERGRAVDDDEIVVGLDGFEHLPRLVFTLFELHKLDVGTGKIDIRRHDIKVVDFRGVYSLTDILKTYHGFVDRTIDLSCVHTNTA